MNFGCDPRIMDFEILIGIAFGRQLRKLVLKVYSGDWFKFPTSLYNSETLETLELYHCILIDVPFPVCLKSLRTLNLHEVEFVNDESVVNLLAGCISLENLVIHQTTDLNVKTFTIAVPSLQRLTVIVEYYEEFSVFVVNTPSLKYLKIEGIIVDDRTCIIENTPELVEASIIDVSFKVFESILGSLASVQRLSLKVSLVEIFSLPPISNTFYHLTYLELSTYKPKWWNLLTLMLDTSPNLQVLKIFDFMTSQEQRPWEKWNEPKNVPECLLLHLETFVWTCYEGKLENEIELAKYILRNARRLKKATFSIIEINPDKRVEMVGELKSVVRASNSCQLVFI
ncbi:FBD / Leucine Rich Repeat domains containing protein [Arabidopsis thaliana]|nr:FBD / Leucine Rich Repeat domains containing protein [Arabidopsis thaliana]NP_189327.5 FBD / Leucine Rich Repeat domains containing protein [Arabidopsis thaliana]AEE77240.1 FBD / Leucine Rich Repeat domains containing protein [Arabidopsis thaliana]ANM65309.1 FBD / Leucine Rich Repeat domains containing protein [Arabidopsis thaliana]|eukprot:NP_001327287.1 FBD / Leucine Rich Repeat domains containing protein [Arabidopsis thaliana]